MPPDYSWLSNTTSESAAQGIDGAWLARSGFLAFGFAVLLLASSLRKVWPRASVWLHSIFGVLIIATAAFSTRSWVTGADFDKAEDVLHSVAATAMGFAFTFGVLARLLKRGKGAVLAQAFDAVAIAAAMGLPLMMVLVPARDGLLQRLMFLVAYLWYGSEALRARKAAPAGE